MRLDNAEDVRRRNLAMLLSKACRTYTNEVLERHKLYDRFADDFINLHRHTDCVCALGKNNHCANLHIVEGILTTRKDLVIRYFVNKSRHWNNWSHWYGNMIPPYRQSRHAHASQPGLTMLLRHSDVILVKKKSASLRTMRLRLFCL